MGCHRSVEESRFGGDGGAVGFQTQPSVKLERLRAVGPFSLWLHPALRYSRLGPAVPGYSASILRLIRAVLS